MKKFVKKAIPAMIAVATLPGTAKATDIFVEFTGLYTNQSTFQTFSGSFGYNTDTQPSITTFDSNDNITQYTFTNNFLKSPFKIKDNSGTSVAVSDVKLVNNRGLLSNIDLTGTTADGKTLDFYIAGGPGFADSKNGLPESFDEAYGFNVKNGLKSGTLIDLHVSNKFPVSATPEPGSWAFMVVGFGAIGALARSRKFGKPMREALRPA